VKKYSTSSAIKEMKIKMTLRFHVIPTRMDFIKKILQNNGLQVCDLEALSSNPDPTKKKQKAKTNNKQQNWVQWFMLVIVVTWETEMGRTTVLGQAKQTVGEIPISKIPRAKWTRGLALAECLLSKSH
jgi:hypothetical protein